jgi:hypothetical protein
MTTDMGRDMAGDMARELGTVFWGDSVAPDPSQSCVFGEITGKAFFHVSNLVTPAPSLYTPGK